MKMTTSKEHYLKAIYDLDQKKEGARISDIAAALKVTKASTSKILKLLRQSGYVDKKENRRVCLTEKGAAVVNEMLNRYDLLVDFIINQLHVEPQIARTDAGKLEHLLSPQTVLGLKKYIEKQALSDI